MARPETLLIHPQRFSQTMPRYKPRDRHSLMLPVELSEQIVPGSLAFAPDYLVDHELDFSAMDAAFNFNDDNTGSCPAGKMITSFGTWYTSANGQRNQLFTASDQDCQSCAVRGQCLKDPSRARGRQVTRFEPKVRSEHDASERMRRAIDSIRGRHLYSQRIGTVEPVFGHIRHNEGLARLNLRGREKVNTQWHLYCMVHNIEKLANSEWRQ